MDQQEPDEFELDIDPLQELKRKSLVGIERAKAKTANAVALLLIIGILVALPLTFISVWLWPDEANNLIDIFARWITVVGPLAGLAVGFYYGHTSGRRDSDAST